MLKNDSFFSYLFSLTPVVELRLTKGKSMAGGYFKDSKSLVKMAEDLDKRGKPEGVYFTLNRLHEGLYDRNPQMKRPGKKLTSDSDITRRIFLLIDLDSMRPSGISANDREKELSIKKATEVQKYLHKKGWPAPIIADSGNGYHLLYRIDLPNTDETKNLIIRVLESLDQKFSDNHVKIDTSVHNAARICKLYGTTARKGNDTGGRPWRKSKVLDMPKEPQIVTESLLEGLVGKERGKKKESKNTGALDIDQWLEEHNISVSHIKEGKEGSRILILEECPWNPEEHKDHSAYVGQLPNGAVFAGCHHETCSGNDWKALKALFQPDQEALEEGLPLNDSGNALRLLKASPDIRYDHDSKTFLLWDGKIWANDTTGQVIELAKRVPNKIMDEAGSDEDDLKKHAAWARKSGDSRQINAMLQLVKSTPPVPVSTGDRDKNPDIICVQNGILDLKTFKLYPHNKRLLNTQITGVPYLEGFTDDDFDQFIDLVLPGEERENLQKLLGRTLAGYSDIAVVLFGPHNSGKSTFKNLMGKMLGSYAIVTNVDAILKGKTGGDAPNSAIASLAHKRAALFSELPKAGGGVVQDGMFKILTGGRERIPIRDLYQKYSLEGGHYAEANPWFATNKMPRFAEGVSAPEMARLQVVSFSQDSEDNPEIARFKHRVETSENCAKALLEFAVEGLKMWRDDPVLVKTEEALEIEEDLLSTNPLYEWATESIIGFVGSSATTKELYNSYTCWREDKFVSPKRITMIEFSRQFADYVKLVRLPCERDKHIKQEDGKEVRGWRGVSLSGIPATVALDDMV